jgi:hypothetical protein
MVFVGQQTAASGEGSQPQLLADIGPLVPNVTALTVLSVLFFLSGLSFFSLFTISFLLALGFPSYLIHPLISSTFGTFPATFTTPSTTKAGVISTP